SVGVVKRKLGQERLGSDPNLQAKKLILNGEAYSVIGVVSSSFKEPLAPDVEVWMPVTQYPGYNGQRDGRFIFAMGRLREGASLEQAQTEATTVRSEGR